MWIYQNMLKLGRKSFPGGEGG